MINLKKILIALEEVVRLIHNSEDADFIKYRQEIEALIAQLKKLENSTTPIESELSFIDLLLKSYVSLETFHNKIVIGDTYKADKAEIDEKRLGLLKVKFAILQVLDSVNVIKAKIKELDFETRVEEHQLEKLSQAYYRPKTVDLPTSNVSYLEDIICALKSLIALDVMKINPKIQLELEGLVKELSSPNLDLVKIKKLLLKTKLIFSKINEKILKSSEIDKSRDLYLLKNQSEIANAIINDGLIIIGEIDHKKYIYSPISNVPYLNDIINALKLLIALEVIKINPKTKLKLEGLVEKLSSPNLDLVKIKELLADTKIIFNKINKKFNEKLSETDKSRDVRFLKEEMETTNDIISKELTIIGKIDHEKYVKEIDIDVKSQLSTQKLLFKMNQDFSNNYSGDKFSLSDIQVFPSAVFEAYVTEITQAQKIRNYARTQILLSTLEQYCEKLINVSDGSGLNGLPPMFRDDPYKNKLSALKSEHYNIYEKWVTKKEITSEELTLLLKPILEPLFKNKESNADEFLHYLLKQDSDTLLAIVNDNQSNKPNALLKKSYEKYLKLLPEVCYQEYLIAQAIREANLTDAKLLRFDPQGTLLTTVTLNEADYKRILIDIFIKRGEISQGEVINQDLLTALTQQASIHYADPPSGKGAKRDQPPGDFTYKELLQAHMGATHTLSATTVCNIDVSLAETLTKNYKTWLETPVVTEAADTTLLNQAIDVLLKPESRLEAGSINAIAEEIEMHMALALKVLEKAFAAANVTIPNASWDSIRTSAFRDINVQVKTIFQQALVKSFNAETSLIDYDQLNELLDENREILSEPDNCYALLIKHSPDFIIDFHTIVDLDAIQQELSKEVFASTTATANDYLAASHLGLTVRIEGTENTAHHKKSGLGHQAARIMHYSDGSKIMRLPSIPDVDNEGLRLDEHVVDTADKINEDAIALRHALGDYQGPIIINRETAIPNNPGFWDAKNQQGKRVEIEMKAVHLLNAKMADSSQFIHIQNLSVNRHSENLGYDTQGTLKEATVMAEMAMIANLHQQVITGRLVDQRGAIVRAYNDVLGIYKNFLTDEKTGLSDAVFSTSDYFNSIKNRLIQAKKVFKKLNAQPESTNTKVLANQALLQIFAHDLHLDHKNGMFIQSLATFAQEGTIAGCKSANERFSSVEGRALLLRLITPRNSRLVNAKKDMTIAIQAFIANPDLANFASAQKKMNKGVNQYTVQARPNGVMSLLDQGGAAKIKVFLKKYWDCLKNIFSGANFNTNRAESPGITRLKTSNTSAMQAHKGNHAKDLKKVLAAKKGEIKTRKFEPDAKISLCLNFLKSELNRLENKVFSSWCNDKRIEFLMALIKKINNPYSIIEGAELVAHMKVIFKEGTQSRNNYDIFMSSQFPTLVADDGLDCCVARATLLSKDDKGVGKEIAITREEVFARPTKADAFVVNENPSPMMVNEDVVTRVTDFEDGVRPSIAIKIGSEGDLERDTFRESTADRLRFSTKAEKPPVLAIVGAEGSIEANDNMYQKAKYAVYSLCSKTVVVGALGTVLALASKAIG